MPTVMPNPSDIGPNIALTAWYRLVNSRLRSPVEYRWAERWKERGRVDGPSRARAAPRDDRAKPTNLWADRREIHRPGKDVALAERSATSLCLSRTRRGRLPGAQLHASVCRGAGPF